MRATMERAPSWVKTPAPPPPRASPTADTPRSSRSRSRPRAALPHPPRREAAAGTLEELARTHPRGHEVRVLACDREAEARRPPRFALGQRRLIAEAPQDPLLARERRRVVDAEQDLALHGERLGPAAGGCVHVAQA